MCHKDNSSFPLIVFHPLGVEKWTVFHDGLKRECTIHKRPKETMSIFALVCLRKNYLML
jgi:hypothetical protein